MKKVNNTKSSMLKNGFKVSLVASLVQAILLIPNVAVAKDYSQITNETGNVEQESIVIDSTTKISEGYGAGIYINWNENNNRNINITSTGEQGDIIAKGNLGIYSLVEKNRTLDPLPTLTLNSNHNITFTNQSASLWNTNPSIVSLQAHQGNIVLNVESQGTSTLYNIYNNNAAVHLESLNNQITLNAPRVTNKYLLFAYNQAPNNQPSLVVNATQGNNQLSLDTNVGQDNGFIMGVWAQANAMIDLLAQSGTNILEIGKEKGLDTKVVSEVRGLYSNQASIKAEAKSNQFSIYAPNTINKYLLYAYNQASANKPNIVVNATQGDNQLSLDTGVGQDNGEIIGVRADPSSIIELLAQSGANILQIGKDGTSVNGKVRTVYGLYSNQASINAEAKNNQFSIYAPNTINKYLLYAYNQASANL